MKQGIPSRRARGRGNTRGRQQSNIRNQQMDSNGPAGRLRGTPQQILDRYSALARDASSSGDMVLAENLWQHAEHYARMLSAAQPQQQQQAAGANGHRYGNGRDDEIDFDDQNETGDAGDIRSVHTGSANTGSANAGSGSNGSGNNGAANNGSGNAPAPKADRGEPEPAPEPLVLKANPEPVPPLDLGNSEQPDTPSVWSEADVRTATEEADAERPTPRRRRRTRFPRQTEASEQDSGDDSGTNSGPGLKLPEDPSPAALVDLLTRAEESSGERKSRARDKSED